jgi:hypothetical protein
LRHVCFCGRYSLLTTYQLVGMDNAWAQTADGSAPEPKMCRTKRTLAMDTLLVATQIICYGVGIVSASLNIASFVHRRVKSRRLQAADVARS